MITLVWIRHGETKANSEKRYLGKTEEPLSEKGISDLQEYKRRHLYPKVDFLFSSPMERCLETAGILYPDMRPIVIPEWTEMDFGLFEYRNYEELKNNIRYQEWLNSNGTLPFPQGESREDFVLRCEKGFARVCEMLCLTARRKKRIPITAGLAVHGGTIMALLSRYAKGNYFDYQVPNGKGYTCQVKKADGAVRLTEPKLIWEDNGS